MSCSGRRDGGNGAGDGGGFGSGVDGVDSIDDGDESGVVYSSGGVEDSVM